jgi:predicted Zn-dependent protease with MMP-like domain
LTEEEKAKMEELIEQRTTYEEVLEGFDKAIVLAVELFKEQDGAETNVDRIGHYQAKVISQRFSDKIGKLNKEIGELIS